MDEIKYTVKKSTRAKSASIRIEKSGEVIVTLPKLVPEMFAKQIIKNKQIWIQDKLSKLEERIGDKRLFNYSRNQYLKYKEEARDFCEDRVAYWAEKMDLKYNRIAIKDMNTRWGSCSSKKNLNFNYKIIFLDDAQADYLIVHELAHLVHMNHSRAF